MARTVDCIISRVPGLKGKDAKTLCLNFDNEEDIVKLSKESLEKLLGHALDKFVSWDEVRFQAEADLKNAALRGIKAVSFGEAEYPPLVREIFDPPALLYFRGVLPAPSKSIAAMVGTRRPSSSAAAAAFILGRELGLSGIPVVSGLALGIDALSHKGNIEGGEATIAVLGSGPDMIYPVSNRPLARRILETGGCILGEYPPGTKPMKWHFPARNRIVSALGRGTLVVEAPERSGALITASFALEHNRDLWVSSAGVSSRIGTGTSRLAQDGARVISSGKEIALEWGLSFPKTASQEKFSLNF